MSGTASPPLHPYSPASPSGVVGTHANGAAAMASQPSSAVPWPRTDRPLRVAMIGWARMSSQGREGSGYNLSKSDLARGLVMSGHSVSYLQSGMSYRLGLGLRAGAPRVAHREDWAGVRCYELLNAPNVAPAAMNFRNVGEETASPVTTRLVLGWLREVGAEVVHVHSQEGYGLDLIGAIEDTGVPVVVTPHNYWFVCPQVDLLHQETRVCEDYEGGRRCVGCLPGRDVSRLKAQRAVGDSLEHWLGLYPADVCRKVVYGAKPFLRALLRGRVHRRWKEPVLNAERLPDPELAAGFDVTRYPNRACTVVHDAEPDRFEQPRDYGRMPWDQNERVLANRDRHLVVLNDYGRRRQAGVAALNRASAVIPPSDYLRRVHVSMGVREERTRRVLLGQPHFDQINRRARRSPYYGERPWDPATATRPLRFAFFGTTRPNKGLEVLARAIPLLATEVRQRSQFVVRAQGFELGFRKRLSRFPEVSVWGGYDLFQLIAAGGEYDVGIMPHIWLENSPLVLLENFHAGKFVVCSRLGGPVDWIRDAGAEGGGGTGIGNGLLFAGGDEQGLAAAITRLVHGEVTIPSPREIHEMTTLESYPGHVAAVEGVYREVLGGVVGKSAKRKAESANSE